MTLGDVVALVAGVAIGLVVATGLRDLLGFRSQFIQILVILSCLLEGTMLALSAVAFTRVTIYHRMPASAEWWSLLIGAKFLADWFALRLDAWTDLERWTIPTREALTPSGFKWLVAGLFSVAIVMGFGCLHLGRQAFPTWLKTIFLVSLTFLAIAGPLGTFDQLGADLLSPDEGFGPGTLSILHRKLCEWTAGVPWGLLFGIPAVAAFIERASGRQWTWIEWAAFGGSSLTLFVSMIQYRGEFRTPSPGWFAERLIVLGWLIVVLLTSWLIVVRLENHWRQWINASNEPGQSQSFSDADSRISRT